MTGIAGELAGGRYRLVEPVGQGGMGRVWRAHDEALNREVAVKEILLPEGISAEQRQTLVERVKREAKVAASLNHRGIVSVHDISEHRGSPVIVMEFVDGRSLSALIEAHGPCSPQATARIGAAILDALAHAHTKGVVHRDLKPDNILVAGDRTVITDFGIARLVDGSTLTAAGTLLGTPNYMAPEQIEGQPATAASDLWSLGATLYAAVEGRPPFSGDNLMALWAAILTQPLQPPQRAGALTPLLIGLLDKDPSRRGDAARAAQYLTALQQSLAAAQHAPANPYIRAPQPDPPRPTPDAQHRSSLPPTATAMPPHGYAAGAEAGRQTPSPQASPAPAGQSPAHHGMAGPVPAMYNTPVPNLAMMPRPGQRPPMPSTVKNAVTLAFTGMGLTLLSTVLALARLSAAKAAIYDRLMADQTYTLATYNTAVGVLVFTVIISGLTGTGMWLWMALKCRAGRNWARKLSTVFFVIDCLSLLTLSNPDTPGVTKFFAVVTAFVGLAAIILLWNSKSAPYFKPAPVYPYGWAPHLQTPYAPVPPYGPR